MKSHTSACYSQFIYSLSEQAPQEGGGENEAQGGLTDADFDSNWDESIETFDGMDLPEELLRGIYSYGFEKPSAIQQRAIKPTMLGRDLIAQAQSGTVRIPYMHDLNCDCSVLECATRHDKFVRTIHSCGFSWPVILVALSKEGRIIVNHLSSLKRVTLDVSDNHKLEIGPLTFSCSTFDHKGLSFRRDFSLRCSVVP
jgi:hypothetical protein